ncbi:putative receptor-like protein kinase At4g00960 isoform X2 [Rosa chinensis]|uniref:putative receptor-like protein kinase At4g00960 isoform X2 n=1 Tax=Rosa chinensis TaxID=74649 RepID=UPI000D097563|nr:putative receptor-like protein kinase At4g00960 isoform X2 [Rosa chinensis]
MVSSSSSFGLFLSLIQLVLLVAQALIQSPPLFRYCINSSGNYTTGSPYDENLSNLLFSLSSSSNRNGHGFYNSSVGENSDKVYALGLCRGDQPTDNCIRCLSGDAIHALTKECPVQKAAFGWYDGCMLRYSNQPLYGILTSSPSFALVNTQDVSSTLLNEFNQKLKALFERLSSQAAAENDLKYATGTQNTSDASVTIYGLTQCTPDLSAQECTECLSSTIAQIPLCCAGKIGGRVVVPSCVVWYEIRPIVAAPASPPLPPKATPTSPPPPPSGKKKSNASQRKVIITVSIVVPLVVLIIFVWIYLRLVRKTKGKFEDDMSIEALQFDFDSIRVATNNFSEANTLGRGGFGAVYKGRLWNEEDIAVKRLSKDSAQGDIEFKNEVILVAKLQHRNLVRLFGFCLERNERLLVYEFVPNASLDHFIFEPVKRADLGWETRYKIIVGIGRGLVYLHEDSRLRIIHRDLKASNILLDAELNPKIADFGMARLFNIDQTQAETSRVVGTYGYMAPEYVMRGHFSVKSDVYSFGVLVLEIISGQKNSSFRHEGKLEDLLGFGWNSWKEGISSNLIDPMLRTGSRLEIMRCIHIGLLCVQQSIADRPTMALVIQMLTSNSVDLPVPSQPAFFMYNHGIGSSSDMSLGFESNSGLTGSDQSKSNSAHKPIPENSTTR